MPPHDGAGGGPDDWPGTVAADALPAAAVRAITERMEARGLTQRALGEALGVTETTVSRWLRRRAAMPLSALARVAELLDETPGRLLDAAGSGPAGPEPADLEALARSLFHPSEPAALPAPAPELASVQADVAALHAKFEQLRRAMQQALRMVPAYQWGTAGDPKGADDAPDPDPAGVEYVPLGRESLVGRRGFAVRVQGSSMAGRGIHDGDTVFVNPDKNYRLGSAVLARVDGAMLVKEVALGPEGQLTLRSAPLGAPPEVVPGGQFNIIGIVVLVVAISALPDGLGNAGDPNAGPPPPPDYAGSSWAGDHSTRRADSSNGRRPPKADE